MKNPIGFGLELSGPNQTSPENETNKIFERDYLDARELDLLEDAATTASTTGTDGNDLRI